MPKKILVVDDDPDFLEWIVTGLSNDGYTVTAVQSAQRGLVLAQQELPDLAIIDARLSDGDGFSVCKELKSKPTTAGIRVILVTGIFKEIEYKQRACQVGSNDFLVKPFSYDQLRARVTTQLEDEKFCTQLL
ncbi:MAG: response regulator [Endomicrobiales bacterium]|jgi:DNA-binding response OmpR family regulator